MIPLTTHRFSQWTIKTSRWKRMGAIIFIGVRFQITWRPSLFPIGSLGKLLTPVGPLFQLRCNFVAWWKPFCGPQWNTKVFAQDSNMCWVFTEIYWSLDEVIMKEYVFLRSLQYIIFPLCNHLNCWERQLLIRGNIKNNRSSSQDLEFYIFVKNWLISRDPVPLKRLSTKSLISNFIRLQGRRQETLPNCVCVKCTCSTVNNP